MKAELVVKGTAGQESLPLRGDRVTIGRGISAHIRIADPLASREHCAIERVGDRFVLRDLASANGTRVNGAVVGEHALEWGDKIQIGETVLLFVFDRESAAAAAETKSDLDIAEGSPGEATQTFVLRSTEVNVASVTREAFVADYLGLFHEIATRLSLQDTVPHVCENLLKTLLGGRRFGRAAVVLLDPSSGAPGERFTLARPGAPARILLDGGELAELHRTGSSIYSRGRKLEDHDFACMLVPLKGRDAAYGALYLDDLLAQATLKDAELHLASAIGLQVGLLIENILYARRLQKEKETLQDMIASEVDIIGESPAMQRVMELIRKVAPTESTVLIRGESGTGKELVARAIHFNSPRRSGPLEVVNCAALPPTLIESELFGHEKGAFTGALARRKGRFESAGGGTLFLDEVGELALEAQAKLLRVLEDRALRRVGGSELVPVDVRVVAATHRNLAELAAKRAFREDLYYRLNVLEIALPALRERAGDVRGLAEHFLRIFNQKMGKRLAFTPEARELLGRYVWPGNVRELRNAMERAVLLAASETLDIGDFPSLAAPPAGGQVQTLQEIEREHVVRVLVATGGNKAEAARLLGVNRSTLYEKLERYRIGQ